MTGSPTEASAEGRHGHAVRIGITGPIGCGKSQVARWLAELGAVAIDADAVAREVTAPGQPAHDAVLAHFGASVAQPDGALDRKALGRLVFADPARLSELEAIVHPAVREQILTTLAAADRTGAPAVVIEAIKLVEGGLAALCNETWLVACSADVQRKRLAGRGTPPDEAEQRIAAQTGLAERLRPVVTRVIDTTGSPEEVREGLRQALAEALAAPR